MAKSRLFKFFLTIFTLFVVIGVRVGAGSGTRERAPRRWPMVSHADGTRCLHARIARVGC